MCDDGQVCLSVAVALLRLQAVDERTTPLWYGGAGLKRRADLRAGDRDRDAVATVLREQHLAGRLDSDEFQERLDHCLAAKTYGELDALVADLPVPEPAPPRAPVSRRLLPLLVALVVIAAVVFSHGRVFWLAFPAFFFMRAMMWRRRSRWGGWPRGGPEGPPPPRSLTTR